MTIAELMKMIEIPEKVQESLLKLDEEETIEIPDELREKIWCRSTWDEGIKELQELIGEDPQGFRIFLALLKPVATISYPEYVKKGISDDIFIATMKFCTRFLNEYYDRNGEYKFVWAWWFPRQMSVIEFRIGALEYEFSVGDDPEIAVHIPSDADLSPTSVQQSLQDFREFQAQYFPEWTGVRLTCDSWMMMPTLHELLGPDSNITAFQDLFEIDEVDNTQTWYMGWIFPGYGEINENLPERTSLQRKLKKYLLAGNRFGIAKGHLK